jgi:hypothetical protein
MFQAITPGRRAFSASQATWSFDDMEGFGGACGPQVPARPRPTRRRAARLQFGRIQRVLRDGLHEFLGGFIAATVILGDEIERF